MNDYQSRVCDCINDKLVDFAMTEAHSIYNLEIMYHHYLQETARLFCNPSEHYTKIMTIAYQRTIKEYKQ